MYFIALLMAAATAIAGAAAYFSVYGLAYTFSGVFWSVVVMGASLEAGKLVAASYLYRYWSRTGWILKTYLITGVVALMVLTSTGIFGYLSTGYQQDVLPLKQKQEQVTLLEQEKSRALDRKKQIDDIIAGNSGSIAVGTDANAARILRETNRGRDQLNRQFREEQKQVTQRVADLDKQLMELKQELIKTEAHIGPIMFVAKAFDMPTDDATKYLIFLIIFAFDPMAVALTLAVNIALKFRQEDKEKEAKQQYLDRIKADVRQKQMPEVTSEIDQPIPNAVGDEEPQNPAEYSKPFQNTLDALASYSVSPTMTVTEDTVEPSTVVTADEQEALLDPQTSFVFEEVEGERVNPIFIERKAEPTPAPVTTQPPYVYNPSKKFNSTDAKLEELVAHLRHLKYEQAQGKTLNDVQASELRQIEQILKRNGYDKYL